MVRDHGPRTKKTLESSLTVREVLSILKTSAQMGISSLSFKGLTVSFKDLKPEWEVSGARDKDMQSFAPPDQVAEESLETEEFATKELQVAELVVTDPAAYERMIETQELMDDDDDGAESGGGEFGF